MVASPMKSSNSEISSSDGDRGLRTGEFNGETLWDNDISDYSIDIDETLVKQFENAKPEDEEAALFALVSTLIHETGHYGKNKNVPEYKSSARNKNPKSFPLCVRSVLLRVAYSVPSKSMMNFDIPLMSLMDSVSSPPTSSVRMHGRFLGSSASSCNNPRALVGIAANLSTT